jgi:hypothetical protein
MLHVEDTGTVEAVPLEPIRISAIPEETGQAATRKNESLPMCLSGFTPRKAKAPETRIQRIRRMEKAKMRNGCR